MLDAVEWTHSYPPEDHPLWEEQVNLERGMLRAGADKVRDRVIEAERRGQMTRIAPLRNLVTDWLPDVAGTIKSWVADVGRSRGPKPIAWPYLKEIDPHVAALVTIRTIVDSLAQQRPKLAYLANHIGRTIEYEQRVRLWEKREPHLFHHYRKEMDKARATNHHRRRVNINRFNALTKDGILEWADWSSEVHFRVGVALLDAVIRKTGWFELQEDPSHDFKRGSTKSPQLIVAPKEGMTDWLRRALDHEEVSSPDFKPTVMPPKRWDGTKRGGYWTPYVKTPRLVRFKASQEGQKERAADEYDALDMPIVYDSVHLLQETAYRINTKVLDVAIECWRLDHEIAGLPKVGEYDLPPRTPRMAAHREQVRLAREAGLTPPKPDQKTDKEIWDWKKKATPIHRANAKRASRKLSTSNTILIAQEYRDYDAIYFPHMLDFRGRIYPVANFLQPQGDDLARGLLLFSEGVPVTESSRGAGWLAIQLASSWGNDKVSFEERIDWVEEREDLWRRIAADPITNREWAVTEEGMNKVDKPWQALAAIFEWVSFLDHGYGYVSHLPVMVDGTCNGIQHLSAITRDRLTGSLVNLTPSEQPQDIYKYVARELQPTIERIAKAGGEEGKKALYWLGVCQNDIPRSLTKRPVMVLPYGGTKEAYFKYIREWLDKMDPPLDNPEDPERYHSERGKMVAFMALHMWDTVSHVVRGGLGVMKWLQDCARVVAVDNQPIYWVTPAGFVVRHFYGVTKEKRVELYLEGERRQITLAERTTKLSVKEQLQGIAPNFIHSLDASALMECLRLCKEKGIMNVMSVHDAYGTHAANMWQLSKLIRKAFVNTHENDVLGGFRGACQRVLVSSFVNGGLDPMNAAEKADEMLPAPMELGDLDLEEVMESDYFFA